MRCCTSQAALANLHPSGTRKQTWASLIDPEKSEEWTKVFKERSCALLPGHTHRSWKSKRRPQPSQPISTRPTKKSSRKRRPYHPKASHWWNAACAVAAQNLRNTQTTETRGIAQARLKGTVRAAKRKWADEYIEKAQLWDVAAWRHGRRQSNVPSLRGPEGIVHSRRSS